MRAATPRLALFTALLAAPSIATRSAAAQATCVDPTATALAEAPVLEGFRLLFQQNGVSFYGRGPAAEPGGPAEVVIRNGNRFPVEVSYSLELVAPADSLPRSLSLGRHCAILPALRYAVAIDSVQDARGTLRVRNLSIADLSGPAASPPEVGAELGAGGTTAPDGPAGASPAAQAGGATPGSATIAAEPGTTTAARRGDPSPVPAPPRADRTPMTGSERPVDAAVGAWALEAVHAAFYVLAAVVMGVGGLGLALAIVSALAVLASAALGALLRRGDSTAR